MCGNFINFVKVVWFKGGLSLTTRGKFLNFVRVAGMLAGAYSGSHAPGTQTRVPFNSGCLHRLKYEGHLILPKEILMSSLLHTLTNNLDNPVHLVGFTIAMAILTIVTIKLIKDLLR